jgi:hypothetical protein
MPSAKRKPVRKAMRSADAYGSPARKQGVAKGTYKSGGLYSSGRAMAIAPGTKKRAKFRDSDTKLGKTTSAKERNMPAKRQNVTSYKPRKGADAYGSPRKKNSPR